MMCLYRHVRLCAGADAMRPRIQGSAEAGVAGYMCSYSSVTFSDNPTRALNTPSCASTYLLRDVIRDSWNWTGYVSYVARSLVG